MANLHVDVSGELFLGEDGDLQWLAEQRRETHVANEALARRAIQRVFDVNARRCSLAVGGTPKVVLGLRDAKLLTVARSERNTSLLVERSFPIWDNICAEPSFATSCDCAREVP